MDNANGDTPSTMGWLSSSGSCHANDMLVCSKTLAKQKASMYRELFGDIPCHCHLRYDYRSVWCQVYLLNDGNVCLRCGHQMSEMPETSDTETRKCVLCRSASSEKWMYCSQCKKYVIDMECWNVIRAHKNNRACNILIDQSFVPKCKPLIQRWWNTCDTPDYF